MTSAFDGYNYTVRLQKGELLAECLLRLAKEKDIRGGWIVGMGGLTWAELGIYDLPAKNYLWTKLEEPLELTSLTGNISWVDDEPFVHLHANVSDKSLNTKGGHLKEAEIGPTAEIFIHRWLDGELNRQQDPEIGLNLLKL